MDHEDLRARPNDERLTDFLTSAILFDETPRRPDLMRRWRNMLGATQAPTGVMPLPDHDQQPMAKLDGRVVMKRAVGTVLKATDDAAVDSVLKHSALVARYETMQKAIKFARKSEFGGIPVYVVPDDPEDIVALYDARSIERPEGTSSSAPLTGKRAEKARAHFEADPNVHIMKDEKSLWSRIMGIFAWNVEEVVKASSGAASQGANMPPGYVDFELVTRNANILVDYFEPYRKDSRPTQFAKTDASNIAKRRISEGIYRFSTMDVDKPNGAVETPSIQCFRPNPKAWTRKF